MAKNINNSSRDMIATNSEESKETNLYTCRNCGQIFETSRLLKVHIRCVHAKWHKCPQCDNSYKTSIELEQHLCSEHKVNGLTCDKCDASFIMKWRLQKHQRIHDDNLNTRNCHFYNSDKECPYSKIGCKFKHQFSVECKYGEKCSVDKCQFRHVKTQPSYSTGSCSMNCDEL